MSEDEVRFELRFRSISEAGRGFLLPCDSAGRVDIESLGVTARSNYLRPDDGRAGTVRASSDGQLTRSN